VTYAERLPEVDDFKLIVLVGTETENPLGAETPTTKLDEEQPTSLLTTRSEYVSCWPGMPHDPVEPHCQLLLTVAVGMFCVHPAVGLAPLAATAVGISPKASVVKIVTIAIAAVLRVTAILLTVSGQGN